MINRNVFVAIIFFNRHVHRFVHGCWDVLANKVRPNRQLPVPTVNQDRQRNPLWPAHVHQGIEGGPNCPPSKEYVVDQDNVFVSDVDI